MLDVVELPIWLIAVTVNSYTVSGIKLATSIVKFVVNLASYIPFQVHSDSWNSSVERACTWYPNIGEPPSSTGWLNVRIACVGNDNDGIAFKGPIGIDGEVNGRVTKTDVHADGILPASP